MHLLAALGLTAFLAAGLAGLGDLLGGGSAADRWVRGWIAAWWPIALTAEAVSPAAAVGVGLAVAAVGLWGAVRRLRRADLQPAVGFAAATLIGAPLWLMPPYFYDTLVYHLGLPWTWLANHSFAAVPHNVFSHFPLAGQTVFLVPVALGAPEAAAGLHWATFVVALAAATRLSGRLGAGRFRWVAPVLLLACWHATWVASVAAVDLLVVVAVLAMAEHGLAAGATTRGRAVGLGAALGLALAVKYTAAIPVAAVLVAAGVFSLAGVPAALAIGVASSSFWWARNLVDTGNPVFPLLWSVLGGRGWSGADDQRFAALVHEGVAGFAGVPSGLLHLVRPPDGLGWWVAAVLPLAVIAATGAGRDARARRLLGLAVVLMLAGWLVTSQTTRYALPLAGLLAVLAAAGLGRLGRGTARLAAMLVVVAALHGFLSLGIFFWGTLGFQRAWSQPEAWRHRVTVDDPLPAYRRCATELPPAARILLVAEGRPWGCPRPSHASSPYDTPLIQAVTDHADSARALAARLRADGFTHLAINWAEVDRLGGADYRILRFRAPAAAARLRTFLRDFTVPLFRAGDVEVRALRP